MDKQRDLTFKELQPGDVFVFTSERDLPYSGMATGPWKKISPRKYQHAVIKQLICQVGTINTTVIKQEN